MEGTNRYTVVLVSFHKTWLTKNVFYSGTKLGGWQRGPKRASRRRRKEYTRKRILARTASSKAKLVGDSVRDNRWERLHSEGSSGSSHRGTREEANDIYFDPREEEKCVFTLWLINWTLFYVIICSYCWAFLIVCFHHIPTSLSFSSSSRDFKKGSGMVDLILMRHNTIKDIV